MSGSTRLSYSHALMYPLPVCRLQVILSEVLPDESLSSVIEVASTRLPTFYTLRLASSRKLTLVAAPSPTTRLLRHEQSLLGSEVALVKYVRVSLGLEQEAASPQIASLDASRNILMSRSDVATIISRLIPSLLKYSPSTAELGVSYAIYSMTSGEPLSNLSVYLSIPEKQRLDSELGTLVRQLANLTSPAGSFGALASIFGDQPQSSTKSSSCSSQQVSSSWPEAFGSLFEAILHDGEDMAVLLPYEEIRIHFDRLSWRLNEIKTPRLVVPDVTDEDNILLERNPDQPTDPSSPTTSRITGLRDWNQAIFGDPMFCSAFENPSPSFLAGWEGGKDVSSMVLTEDVEGNESRMLLYKCYRAVVLIVTQYYRPHIDSSSREMEGRRKLTSILADLEQADRIRRNHLREAREH